MSREDSIRESNIETNNKKENILLRESVIDLYEKLITEYTEDRILSYIEKVTQVDKNIAKMWLNQPGYNINTAIANKIVLSLRNFTPDKLAGILARLRPPLALKKSSLSE